MSATAKPSVVERGDREARPVDGDRALLDDVAEELGRRVEPDAAAVALGLDAADGADAVDVPLDVVAAERLAGPERRLDVDARARREAAERGARERLGHGVEARSAPSPTGDRGQAAAADRDRVADGRAARRLGRLDLEPHPVAARLERGDAADLAHDPREHARAGSSSCGPGPPAMQPWQTGSRLRVQATHAGLHRRPHRAASGVRRR